MKQNLRRLTALTLALMLALGLSLTGFASSVKIENGVFVSSLGYTQGDTYDVGAPLSDVYQDFEPGDVFNIFLDPSKITGLETPFTPETGMSARDLSRVGIDFRVSSGKNSNLIKNVAYKEQTLNDKRVAVIQVQLVDDVATTEEKEFETTISLYANKQKQQSLSIAGVIGGEVIEVTAGDPYVYLGDGQVAKATEAISRIEVDAGNNLTLKARMHKGKKYYAVASIDPTASDLDIMYDHPEVELVYNLSTSGFIPTDVDVNIKEDSKLFVYDADGKYLGTTADDLDLSSKYYLASKEVDLDLSDITDGGGDIDEPDLPDPSPGDTDGGEGGGGIGGGGSGIPDTGIGTGPKVATFAVVAALATIGVVTFTSRKKDD